MIPKPKWFDRNVVVVSTAATCGISKAGGLLVRFDPTTGAPLTDEDPDTGEQALVVDDQLLADMEALRAGRTTSTLQRINRSDLSMRLAVPTYYDRRYHEAFTEAMQEPEFAGFTSATLGDLVERGTITIRHGHGSAPKDIRVGEVPYIKVSDLRAGLVNINPTNSVPRKMAESMWGDSRSGLVAFDLISPERASKNIGDFCVLMPGQEQILVTKEVIVLRPGHGANFDAFYLLWALTLRIVRSQWNRVVFMQTNREDVGSRYLEIEIPLPPSQEKAEKVSREFRDYYTTLAGARAKFRAYLAESQAHHFFVAGAEELEDLDETDADSVEVPEEEVA